MKVWRSILAGAFNCWFSRMKEKIWKGIRQSEAISDEIDCLRRIVPLLSGQKEAVRQYLEEIETAQEIRERVEYYVEHYGYLPFSWSWHQRFHGKQFSRVLFLYLLLRLIRPENVIETGCFSGWTSTLILYALHRNEKGHLWTIDLPAQAGRFSMDASLPQELTPGFLVPDMLRPRWTLIIGDTREHLPPLLHRLENIDVFYHDSDHTYEHMMWEYTTVWPYLRQGGILISDDIGANTAFWDFAVAMGCPMAIPAVNPNFGAISKMGEMYIQKGPEMSNIVSVSP